MNFRFSRQGRRRFLAAGYFLVLLMSVSGYQNCSSSFHAKKFKIESSSVAVVPFPNVPIPVLAAGDPTMSDGGLTSTPGSSSTALDPSREGCNIGVRPDNSRDFPEIRSVGFANIWLDGVKADPAGQIDMQVSVGLAMSSPNFADGKQIWPCSEGDPNLGACQVISTCYGAYYALPRYSAVKNPNPYGIFINSQDPNNCLGRPGCNSTEAIINHRLPNKLNYGTLEIYPSDWDDGHKYTSEWSKYGGVRVAFNFGAEMNGGVYSDPLGTIQMPHEGDPNTGNINGFISYSDGRKPADGQIHIDLFQTGMTTATSSSGHAIMGFSSLSNKSDGYWRSAPLFLGVYDIYIGDEKTRKKIHAFINITQSGMLMNIDLDKPESCFGTSLDCTVVPY